MLRLFLLAALVPLTRSPAIAQADDPARTACEALARDIAGPEFARVGWTMVERTVFISYKLSSTGEQHQFSCGFQLEAPVGQWTFARAPVTENAIRCARISTADMPEQLRGHPQMQAALEKCAPVMKAEELRLARLPMVEQQLRLRGQYPIKRQDTGLKPDR